MGIEEMLLDQAYKKGYEEGFKIGFEKGKAEVVENLIIKISQSDAQIADIVEVPADFVKKIRRSELKKLINTFNLFYHESN